MRWSLLIALCVVLIAGDGLAAADEALPMPRFASIKSKKVNLRVGPGENYPILWVYKRPGLPVEIIDEHQTWRKVRDPEGDEGWMLKNMLSGKRTAIVTNDKVTFRRKPETTAPALCFAMRDVVLNVEECNKDWCLVSNENRKGWADKKGLWGIYPNEAFGD